MQASRTRENLCPCASAVGLLKLAIVSLAFCCSPLELNAEPFPESRGQPSPTPPIPAAILRAIATSRTRAGTAPLSDEFGFIRPGSALVLRQSNKILKVAIEGVCSTEYPRELQHILTEKEQSVVARDSTPILREYLDRASKLLRSRCPPPAVFSLRITAQCFGIANAKEWPKAERVSEVVVPRGPSLSLEVVQGSKSELERLAVEDEAEVSEDEIMRKYKANHGERK